MDEENVTEGTNDVSPSVPYDCNSVCPICLLVSNDCVLGINHDEEKHMCANGHFWL